MPTYIDLFAGCGGLSLGLKQAGWTGLFAVEKNADAFATIRHNLIEQPHVERLRYEWPTWLPIQSMAISTLLRRYRAELAGLRGSVDLIAGGPPCQGFSTLGLRDSSDRRNLLFREYLEVVRIVRPRLVLLENVKGITARFTKGRFSKSKAVSDQIADGLRALGYAAFPRVIDAATLGVPQRRVRFFLVAVDVAYLPTGFDPFEDFDSQRRMFLNAVGSPVSRPVTVRQAISDLEIGQRELIDSHECKGFRQIRYRGPKTAFQRSMREGMEPFAPPNSLRLPNHKLPTIVRFKAIAESCVPGKCVAPDVIRALNTSKRHVVLLDESGPASTITTLPDDCIHYSEPRILTVRECARLQTFPDWFEFIGKYTTGGQRRKHECPRYTQVGNAVPPRAAQFLGSVLIAALSKLRSPKALRRAG